VKPVTILVLVAGALLAIALWARGWHRPDDVVDKEQRQHVARADSSHRARVTVLKKVRRTTDAVLADPTSQPPNGKPTITKDSAKTLVHHEREACDTVLAADSAQVKERDTRIKTLEHRLGGTLFIYAEGGLAMPVDSLLGSRLEGEAGLAIRLKRDLFLQAGMTMRREARLTVRRQWRLF
jgi:hypothetical protein